MKIVQLSDITEEGLSHAPEIKKKVMLSPSDLPHLTNFSQACFSPGQRAVAHSHSDMFEVFLVESGSGVIRVDGEEHRLERGTCVVVQPGEVHEIVNSGSGVLVLTYFGLEA